MKHLPAPFRLFIPLGLALAVAAGCFAAGCLADGQLQSGEEIQGPDSVLYGTYSPGPSNQQNPAVLKQQEEFDQLTEELFLTEVSGNTITLHYTLADPESLGISRPAPSLGSVSLGQSQSALREMLNLKQELSGMDPDSLLPDQLLTWKILNSYLNTQLSANGLELYDQPLSSSIGIQAQLPILLCEYSFYSRQDVEDYLGLLADMDRYFGELLAFEQQKSAAGLGLCDASIDRIGTSCQAYLGEGGQSFLTDSFRTRLDELSDLTDEKKQDYMVRHQEAIKQYFIPAYEHLYEGLMQFKGSGGNDKGLYYLPQGRQYYEYLVKSSTHTSYGTVEELRDAIALRMTQDLTAMEEILTKDPDLAQEASSYAFSLTEPGAILEDLKQQCAADFPQIPQCSYTVKEVPQALEASLSPAFYLTVPLDRPQDNSIYINPGSTSSSRNLYTTMAHEGWPGHMYQTQYFNQTGACNLRKLLSFSSYTEGWATYVEYYAYRLDNGLAPGLGELLAHNSSFTLALYALLDINIHYEGWDLEQMGSFLNQFFSISDEEVISTIYYDIAENPANYLEYYTGYLEISNMEKEARESLKDSYSPLSFHTFLLDMGPAPFDVIWEEFEGWVASEIALGM